MAAQFSWAAAADVGLGIAGAFGQWGAASAARTVARANADAANVVRGAQNQQRAANTSLAATMRSLQYKAALTNAGEASNAGSELIARTQESFTRGNFEQGLRDMEQLGAYTARAAASGVGGASVRAVSYTVRLQQARLAERTEERQGEQVYELNKARAGIFPAAASRLDISPLTGGMDYSRNVAPGGGGGGTGLILALTQGLFSKRESLQVALDSIARGETTTPLSTGDFARMDRTAGIPDLAESSAVRFAPVQATDLPPIFLN